MGISDALVLVEVLLAIQSEPTVEVLVTGDCILAEFEGNNDSCKRENRRKSREMGEEVIQGNPVGARN